MATGTRSTKTTKQAAVSGTKKAAPTKQSKKKAVAEDHSERSDAEIMDDAPAWAKALQRILEGKVNSLGEYMEEVDGRVGDLSEKVTVITGVVEGATDASNAAGDATAGGNGVATATTSRGQGVVIREPPLTRPTAATATIPTVIAATTVHEDDRWARLVERFNKLKPKPFDGKGTMTDAARWKDAMRKVFNILKIGDVDRQRLAVFNLEGGAWEWWESVSTEAEQDTVTWIEFQKRFDTMFMPETSKNAKELELHNLHQGSMTVDQYEQKFRELCHYASTLIMDDENRRCRMFERGLRDEIRTSVSASMFTTYARVVESARSVELTAPKPKAKEAAVTTVVKPKVEESKIGRAHV